MQSKKYGLTGVGSSVEVGLAGPRVKRNVSALEARNNADSAFAVIRAASPVGDNDVVTKQYLETNANVYVNGQIDGGAPPSPADGVIYIVTSAGGGFALGELYRREAAAWVAVSLPDGLRISVADPLTGGTDEYVLGVYLYDLDTTSWTFIGPATTIAKVMKAEIATLVFGSAATLNIGSQVPASSIISKVTVSVTQAFDGTAPTLDIGDSGDANRLMDQTEVDLKTVGVYVSDVYNLYGALTQLEAAYVADSSTTGQAAIVVEFRLA